MQIIQQNPPPFTNEAKHLKCLAPRLRPWWQSPLSFQILIPTINLMVLSFFYAVELALGSAGGSLINCASSHNQSWHAGISH